MKITILITTFCFCFIFLLRAQTPYSVKGTIVDTSSKAKLANTSVIVLNAKDSILRKFTRADINGGFSINNLPNGKFILLITYPGYADYVENFALDSAHRTHDFGRLNMILKAKLLSDVIVKGTRVPIKIKGDTTEFNARAYTIQPNDKVEDLLRQLPGIEVDKDGKITAQGQTVNKVLVDGEEFFGDDPTLVTKNIRADMVDKVQLYDKKSDQATFTGVDDGVRTKTINIKLREDKKNGVFGELNGNLGTDGYYEGQLLYNRFKANQRFSAYGTLANDGRIGLGFNDASRLGAGNGDIQFIDGGISINTSGNDALDSFSGYYDGKGLPTARSGGVHYDDKWNGDKESLNTNYKLGSIEVEGATTSTIQQTLPTGIITTNSNQNFDNYAFRQKLDATYQLKLDTSSNLKISADGTFRNFHVNNDYSSVTDSSGVVLNRNNRSVVNHGNASIFDASALYTKKFHKVGRTLSWSLSETYNQNQTQGYLNSETDFYNTSGAKDSTQVINQYKTTNSVSSVLNSNIVYSEPLSKKTAVLFNYGLGINNSTTDRLSYDQSAPGVYNILDNTYSNNYKFNQLTNQLGAIFNYKTNKIILNFGTKASGVNFKQVDEFTGDVLKRNFINWAPQATFQYKYSQQKSFYLNYTGVTTQPTIDQIQPVLVNTDPLNITIGNPGLKPSFTNRFFMYYNNYQVISSQYFYMNANYSNTINPIVNNTIESAGKTITQYVNLADKDPYNYSVYMSINRKIQSLAGIQAGLNFNTSGNVSYSYINNALDMGNSHTYNAGLNISKYVQNKYDFYINGGPSYTFTSMSLQPLANNNAAGFSASGRFDLYLPVHFAAGSDVRYTYAAQTQSFSAEYKTIWNAYIYKTLTKDQKLKISLSVNDLLNQNTNFTRGISGNTTTQTNTTGIRRFFMLSVVWDFNKFGTLPAKQ
jgi:hypothetical protein